MKNKKSTNKENKKKNSEDINDKSVNENTRNNRKSNSDEEEDFQNIVDVNQKVKLIKLVVVNFKSFQGRHEIGFFKNYTSIVGANGSGKSNIIDAISFACGINSKYLRSENLNKLINTNSIASGSNSGSGKEISSVELHFEITNSKNEKKDLLVKRKVFSTKSEYLINDKKTTLEDYKAKIDRYDISKFAKYFIIAQGSIDSILSSQSQLTEYIEGLSGSIQFKSKYENLSKDIEANKDRLNYLEKQLTVYRKKKKDLLGVQQSDSHFAEIDENLNIIIKEIFLFKLLEQDKLVETNHNNLLDSEISYEKVLTKKDEIVKLLNQSKIELRKKDDSKAQKEYNEISNEQKESQTKIKFLEDKFSQIESQVMSKISVLQEEKSELNKKEANISFYKSEKEKLLKKKNEITKTLSKTLGLNKLSDKEIVEFTHLKNQFELEANSQIAEKDELGKKIISLEEAILQLDKKEAALADESSSLQVSVNSSKTQEESQKTKLEESQKRIKEITKEVNENEKARRELIEKLNKLEKEYFENKTIIDKYQHQVGLNSKRKRIKEIGLPGIIGFLNELVYPLHKKYELALKVALSKYLNYLIVDNYHTAKQCMKFFDENDISQDILVLDQVPLINSPFNNDSITQYGTLMTSLVLEKKKEVKPVINYFLKNLFFCHEKESIRKLQTLGCKSIILIDGTIIKKGVITGGAYNNLIALENDFSEVDKKIKDQKELEQRLEKESNKIHSLEENIKVGESNIKELDVNISLITQRINLLKERIEEESKILSGKQIEISKISQKQSSLRIEKDSLEKSINELNKELNKKKKIFYSEFLKSHKGLENEINLEFNDLEKLHKESILVEERIQKIEKEFFNLEEKKKKIVKLEENLNKDKDTKQEIQREIETLKEKQKNISKQVKTKKEVLDEIAKAVERLNTELKNLESELERLEGRIAALYKNKLDYEFIILNAIKEKAAILEEFKLNLNNYLKKFNFSVLTSFELNVSDYILDKTNLILRTKDMSDAVNTIAEQIFYEINYTSLEDKESNPKSMLEKLEIEFQKVLTEKDEAVQLKIKSTYDEKYLDQIEEELKKQKKEIDEQLNEELKLREKLNKEFIEVQKLRKEMFENFMKKIQNEINDIYRDFYPDKLFNFQDCAKLVNTNPSEPYLGATIYSPTPPGKGKSNGLGLLSGGEKTIAIIALIFALQKITNVQFLVFDEIDAYLDKRHEELLENQLIKQSEKCQIILITHKSSLCRSSESLIGTYYNKKVESSIALSMDMSKLTI